jgi:hypothetical protein
VQEGNNFSESQKFVESLKMEFPLQSEVQVIYETKPLLSLYTCNTPQSRRKVMFLPFDICRDELSTLDGWIIWEQSGNNLENLLGSTFEELVCKSSFVENYGNNFRLFIGGHFELWKKIQPL